jgi:hypothetical protein
VAIVLGLARGLMYPAECCLAGRSLLEHEGRRVGLEHAPGETVKVGRNSGFAVAIRQQSVDVEPVLEQMGKGARLERWIACPGRTNGGSKHL